MMIVYQECTWREVSSRQKPVQHSLELLVFATISTSLINIVCTPKPKQDPLEVLSAQSIFVKLTDEAILIRRSQRKAHPEMPPPPAEVKHNPYHSNIVMCSYKAADHGRAKCAKQNKTMY